MPPEAGDTELGGDGVERATAKVREEPARQTKRADDGGIDRPSRQHLLCRVQVGDVEGGIVRHQHGISGERKELRQHGANGRGIGYHRVRDPRQPADEGRDRVGRLHEARERVEEPSPGHAHRADLDDALRGGRTAGGLEIHHHEGGLAERTRERIVDPRPPAIGARVEMKARVRAEQGGEEAAAELRVTSRRGEDQIEELVG